MLASSLYAGMMTNRRPFKVSGGEMTSVKVSGVEGLSVNVPGVEVSSAEVSRSRQMVAEDFLDGGETRRPTVIGHGGLPRSDRGAVTGLGHCSI